MRVGGQKLIELSEYMPTRFSRSMISDDVGEYIFRQYKNQVAIEFPTPKTDYQWQLISLGWVGFIPLTSEISLYLSPKVPLKTLFGMIEYAYRLNSFQFIDGLITCNSLEEFYEQIAKILAKNILIRGKKGFYRSYYSKNEQLPYICGRLDIQKTSRQPWNINLACRYEEFTSDIEDNQILAWTLHKILLTGMCTETSLPIIRLAYRTMQGFASLKPFGPKACIKRLYNRLNQDYLGMHAICRFFLENSGPKHETGSHNMIPFLVDMDRLFELFVSEWLKAHLPSRYSIRSQEAISLNGTGNIVFKIDLVLYDETTKTPLCVLDTKYKVPDKPSNSDISQVVFYALAKKCTHAVLIYPTVITSPFSCTVSDIKIETLTFALDMDLDQAGYKFIQELTILLSHPEHGQNSGQTKEATVKEKQWDEDSFFKDLELRRGPGEVDTARKILEWAKDKLPKFWWGKGKIDGSFFPILDHNGISYYPFCIWTYGKVEIQFQWLKNKIPFDNESKRMELLDRLNLVPGVRIPADAITRRPNIPLSQFKESEKLKQFLDILDWVVQEIKAS